MAAPKGNQFWKLRSKHGRDKLFKTPKLMLEAAYEYFKWCDENPLIEIDFMNSKSGPVKIEKPKMRAYTMHGLCIYLDVNTIYFNRFEEERSKEETREALDFCKVITHVKEIIYNQKFSGAAAGFLNANIIARDLGLKDHSDITSNDKDFNNNISDAELLGKLTKYAERLGKDRVE
jgi:hypothetical protein